MAVSTRKLITPEEATKRMIEGASNAAGRWEDGIQHPRKSFKQAAIDAADKHTKRTQEALAEGRFAKGMRQVDEDAAIQTALAKGGGSVSAGMQAREGKIRQRVAKYFGHLAPHMDKIDGMPSATQAEAETKMLANMRGMKEIGKKMRE